MVFSGFFFVLWTLCLTKKNVGIVQRRLLRACIVILILLLLVVFEIKLFSFLTEWTKSYASTKRREMSAWVLKWLEVRLLLKRCEKFDSFFPKNKSNIQNKRNCKSKDRNGNFSKIHRNSCALLNAIVVTTEVGTEEEKEKNI